MFFHFQSILEPIMSMLPHRQAWKLVGLSLEHQGLGGWAMAKISNNMYKICALTQQNVCGQRLALNFPTFRQFQINHLCNGSFCHFMQAGRPD